MSENTRKMKRNLCYTLKHIDLYKLAQFLVSDLNTKSNYGDFLK